MFDFGKVKGDYSRYSESLKKNFESTATRHMDCLENPDGYEPVSVKYDRENHRHIVMTRCKGKFYYSLNGEWY